MISEYTIEDENIIKEYAAIDTEGGYLEMIRFIHPNGFAHSVIKVNGELYEEFDQYNLNYFEFFSLYQNQFRVTPLCNLDDNNYKHIYVNSTTKYYPQDDLAYIKVTAVGGVALILSSWMKAPYSTVVSVASWIYGVVVGSNPNAMTVVENEYDVYFQTGGYFSVCYHVNIINYDSGGHVTGGGGMHYYQP